MVGGDVLLRWRDGGRGRGTIKKERKNSRSKRPKLYGSLGGKSQQRNKAANSTDGEVDAAANVETEEEILKLSEKDLLKIGIILDPVYLFFNDASLDKCHDLCF